MDPTTQQKLIDALQSAVPLAATVRRDCSARCDESTRLADAVDRAVRLMRQMRPPARDLKIVER